MSAQIVDSGTLVDKSRLLPDSDLGAVLDGLASGK
jgi:hypothetical protein